MLKRQTQWQQTKRSRPVACRKKECPSSAPQGRRKNEVFLTVRLLEASTGAASSELLGLAATGVGHEEGAVVGQQDVLHLLLLRLVHVLLLTGDAANDSTTEHTKTHTQQPWSAAILPRTFMPCANYVMAGAGAVNLYAPGRTQRFPWQSPGGSLENRGKKERAAGEDCQPKAALKRCHPGCRPLGPR